MNSLNNENTIAYEQKYSSGYGLMVPDGHVVRIYNAVLKHELGLTSGSMLDFGCGNGIHCEYFLSQGCWNVAGVDVSKVAINYAKERLPDFKSRFFVTADRPDLTNIFGSHSFDVALCNQSLYYVDDEELIYLLSQIKEVLKPGGVVIATMLSSEGGYYRNSQNVPGDSRRRVTLSERLNETTFINFKNKEEVIKDFSMFTKLHYGFYDIQIRENESNGKHHIFIGTRT